MSRGNSLFSSGDLDAKLRARQNCIVSEVDSISRDQFLNTSIEELAQYILSKIAVEPLILYEDKAVMEQQEKKIDVPSFNNTIYMHGTEVVITIPYSGTRDLWDQRPNQFRLNFPHADVQSPQRNGIGQLQITLSKPANEAPERFKTDFNEILEAIRFYLDVQRKQIEMFNAGLLRLINIAIIARRERIKKNENIKDILGIPLKQRDGVPSTDPIVLTRNLVRPLPPVPNGGYLPEPGITDDVYKHILSVVRHEGRTFEATPKTYSVHDEEELRDILRAHLNGHYQGSATGETFRRNGKTDICIEDTNRAAFVAECKIWRGKKEFSDAINQLLGYLTWRDCKAALIIFNKHNAKFTELLTHIPEAIQAHEKFRQSLINEQDGEWEFLMSSKEDNTRPVRVHIFVFNLYVAKPTAS